MHHLKRFFASFLTGKGRSSIAVFLAMALALGLIGPPAGHGADRRDCGHSGGCRSRQLHYEYHRGSRRRICPG